MTSHQYTFSSLKDQSELTELKSLFNEVFPGEHVGDMAESITRDLPGMDLSHWYTARDSATGELAAALTRTDWNIHISDIPLKVWEQAIVGTRSAHRGKGLMRNLNDRLHSDASEAGVDMLIIQGIPDFYRRFGYRYAIAFENHINLDLDLIESPEGFETASLNKNFREAGLNDLALFYREEKRRDQSYLIKTHRSKENWSYYFNEGKSTEYSSETWIYSGHNGEVYFKIQHQGFGEGLIVSEISDNISERDLDSVLMFLRTAAEKKKKPCIRFNLPLGIPVSQKIIGRGAVVNREYGWQVKIPDAFGFIEKIRPVLQKRLTDAECTLSGVLCLNLGKEVIALTLKRGKISALSREATKEAWPLILPRDLFEPLVLGYRSPQEIQKIRPDLYPWGSEAEELLKILFPRQLSWLYNIW